MKWIIEKEEKGWRKEKEIGRMDKIEKNRRIIKGLKGKERTERGIEYKGS